MENENNKQKKLNFKRIFTAGMAAALMYGTAQADLKYLDSMSSQRTSVSESDPLEARVNSGNSDTRRYIDEGLDPGRLQHDPLAPFAVAANKPVTAANDANKGKTTDNSSQAKFSMYKTGDIIAHTSRSQQSATIASVTASNYTHIGIIVNRPGGLYVLEAVGPVKYTPLQQFIDNGVGKRYTVKRLKPELQDKIPEMIKHAESFLGKPYDILFDPSDAKMYCSELVEKAAEKAGVSLGKWEKFQDLLGWSRYNPVVRYKVEQRWGKLPDNIKMVTPKSIMESGNLTQVYSNF